MRNASRVGTRVDAEISSGGGPGDAHPWEAELEAVEGGGSQAWPACAKAYVESRGRKIPPEAEASDCQELAAWCAQSGLAHNFVRVAASCALTSFVAATPRACATAITSLAQCPRIRTLRLVQAQLEMGHVEAILASETLRELDLAEVRLQVSPADLNEVLIRLGDHPRGLQRLTCTTSAEATPMHDLILALSAGIAMKSLEVHSSLLGARRLVTSLANCASRSGLEQIHVRVDATDPVNAGHPNCAEAANQAGMLIRQSRFLDELQLDLQLTAGEVACLIEPLQSNHSLQSFAITRFAGADGDPTCTAQDQAISRLLDRNRDLHERLRSRTPTAMAAILPGLPGDIAVLLACTFVGSLSSNERPLADLLPLVSRAAAGLPHAAEGQRD